MRDLYKFVVHVVYVRCSVFVRHVDDRPHRLSARRGDGAKCNLRLPCSICNFSVCHCVDRMHVTIT